MSATTKALKARTFEAARLIRERYDAFLADPNDPETNHKLRVSIRTVRSLVDFLKPWQKADQNERILKDLKRVVRETSRLRELDVLCELVAQREDLSDEVLSLCEQATASERERVLNTLQTASMVKRLKRSVRAVGNLEWKKRAKKGLAPADVRSRFDELAERLNADLETLDESDYERVHDIRKRAKQVRYVSEQYVEILGEDALETARQMKGEQDRLGALCDEKVNRELLEGFLATLGGDVAPREDSPLQPDAREGGVTEDPSA